MKKTLIVTLTLILAATASAYGTFNEDPGLDLGESGEIPLEISQGNPGPVQLTNYTSNIEFYPENIQSEYVEEDLITFTAEVPEDFSSKQYTYSATFDYNGTSETVAGNGTLTSFQQSLDTIPAEQGTSFSVDDKIFTVISSSNDSVELDSPSGTICEEFSSICSDNGIGFEILVENSSPQLNIYSGNGTENVSMTELNVYLNNSGEAVRGSSFEPDFVLEEYETHLHNYTLEGEYIGDGAVNTPLNFSENNLSFEADFEDVKAASSNFTLELQDFNDFTESSRPGLSLRQENLYEGRMAVLNLNTSYSTVVEIGNESFTSRDEVVFTVPDVDELEIIAYPEGFSEASSTLTQEVVRDSSGDGVFNDEDECPDEAGLPANDGCPPEPVSISVTNSNGESVDLNELQVGEPYSFSFDSDTVFEGQVLMENLDEGRIANVSVSDGEHEFIFEEAGTHTVSLEEMPMFEASEIRFEVTEDSGNLMLIAGILTLLAGSIATLFVSTDLTLESVQKRLGLWEEPDSENPGGEPDEGKVQGGEMF